MLFTINRSSYLGNTLEVIHKLQKLLYIRERVPMTLFILSTTKNITLRIMRRLLKEGPELGFGVLCRSGHSGTEPPSKRTESNS